MKFLALTTHDQGILIEANNLEQARSKLKERLSPGAAYQEVKLVSLIDGTEKHLMAVPGKQKGGVSFEDEDGVNFSLTPQPSLKEVPREEPLDLPKEDQLYTVAHKLNEATETILNLIDKSDRDKGPSGGGSAVQAQEGPQACVIM
jgi:hypothetical protein